MIHYKLDFSDSLSPREKILVEKLKKLARKRKVSIHMLAAQAVEEYLEKEEKKDNQD